MTTGYETDYNNALAAFESDYTRTLELWRQKENDYETNYSVSTRKQSALKEEIEALEKEKETLKGIFSGRRRKVLGSGEKGHSESGEKGHFSVKEKGPTHQRLFYSDYWLLATEESSFTCFHS